MNIEKYVCDCGKHYIPNAKYKDVRVKCDSCIKKSSAREMKLKAVHYKGGKCKDCNFDGHSVAFDFDHKNPTEKKFKLSGKALALFRWKEIKRELDQCDLRCSNCHRIRHYIEKYPDSR